MSKLEQLENLSRIPLKVSAVLGKTSLTIGQLLQMEPGTVLELDREVDDEIDVCVNGSPVAKGELMVENGRLGITITRILDNEEK